MMIYTIMMHKLEMSKLAEWPHGCEYISKLLWLTEAQWNPLQNLRGKAVFMTNLVISLFYQKIINMS